MVAWAPGSREGLRTAAVVQRLDAGDVLSVRRSERGVVRDGRLWLTDGGCRGDLILECGSVLHGSWPGRTVIQALEPTDIEWFTSCRRRPQRHAPARFGS